MSEFDLEAIRARDAACAVPKAPIEAVQWAQSNADRRALLAAYDALAARLAEEVKNKKEFERDWLAACDELCNTRSRLADLTKAVVDGGVCRLCEKRISFGHAPSCPMESDSASGNRCAYCGVPDGDGHTGDCQHPALSDQPNAARKTVWKPYDVFGVTGRLVYEDTGEDVPDQPGEADK